MAEDLPMIDPSGDDLFWRLQQMRDTSRAPLTISMSPETWDRLSEHAMALRRSESELLFDKVPVRLYAGQLGVAISFDQH